MACDGEEAPARDAVVLRKRRRLDPKKRILRRLFADRAICEEVNELKDNMEIFRQKLQEVTTRICLKKRADLWRKTRGGFWNSGTRLFQHSTILLLILCGTLQVVSLILTSCLPELFLEAVPPNRLPSETPEAFALEPPGWDLLREGQLPIDAAYLGRSFMGFLFWLRHCDISRGKLFPGRYNWKHQSKQVLKKTYI